MKLPDSLEFLTASRFWAGVIMSASIVLVDPAFPNQPWYVSLGKFLGLVAAQFIAVRTIDKNVGEAKILSAGVSTGEVATEDATPLPPQK